jgi:ribosomal protein S18 acetylase RimI-like enzyme
MTAATIEMHPLSPSRVDDFISFFDSDAFTDNPHWSSCYCQCFYEDHSKLRWDERTATQNRDCALRRIAGREMRGILAYEDGKVVGWCNAAPRSLLHALDNEPAPDSDQTGTILCFLVAPEARGRGIANALLHRACETFREQGLTYVEANPRPSAAGSAENHYGPLSMYLAAGFSVRRTDADGSVWVGRDL